MNDFVNRHHDNISGVLSCFDRVIINGTLPDIAYSGAMQNYLYKHDKLIFDFSDWAQSLRDRIRTFTEAFAAEQKIEIEFIRKHKAFRKEARIQEILATRGTLPGLVHIFSAMETCSTYKPWHDKPSGHTNIKFTSGKCLHYYFYFIDEQFGLCYLRIPTWAPFRLQVYFNGHSWLARQLDSNGITYQMADNAFLDIENFSAAQRLSDKLSAKTLHRALNRWTRLYFPCLSDFPAGIHWSFMQVEYATDVVFKRQAEFQPLYDAIIREAVHSVKADQVATFLGRKLTATYSGEAGNDFSTRIQGTRIRHAMGPASIKLYDKAGIMARVECTTNDISFFKHHRTVEQRDGTDVFKLAPLRKNIYSLHDLRGLMSAANQRYLAYMASIDNPDVSRKNLDKLTRPVKDKKGRSSRGFNLFLEQDRLVFLAIIRGEWCISGFRSSWLRENLPGITSSQCCAIIKRLRLHGLIKKIGHQYKYYLTKLGRKAVTAALSLIENTVTPEFA